MSPVGAHSTDRRWTLAIETSNPSAIGAEPGIDPVLRPGVAAARAPGEPPFDLEPLEPTGRHDDDLMPAIDRLARRNALDPRAIGRVAVCVGPGGYTGLRIAVVTAKMLALASGARAIPVPAAAIAALDLAPDEAPAVILLASKREAAWAALARAGTAPEHVGVIDAERLARLIDAHAVRALIGDAHVPDGMRAVAERCGCDVRTPELGPARCARAARETDAIGPAALEPLYAREPEAARVWRERSDRPEA